MWALFVIAGVIAAMWILWSHFVVVMALQEVRSERGKLTVAQKVFGFPHILVGLPLDWLIEKTLASVIFLELSHNRTVSDRLKEYVNTRGGWRRRWAVWIRQQLLAPFDESGGHGKVK